MKKNAIKKTQIGPLWKIFEKKIRMSDSFGKPVSLSIDGEQSFKTFIGGVTTIILYSFLFAVFVRKSIKLFGRMDASLTMQTTILEFDNDSK